MSGPLFWKEWQPLRWKLVFACVLVGSFEAIALRTRIIPDVGVYVMTLMGTILLMPVFTAMGIFAGEREEESLAFQAALPVDSDAVYFVKMIVGAAVSAAPLLAGLLVGLFVAGGREEGMAAVATAYLNGMFAAALVFVWVAVFSIGCRQEAFVPLVYVGLGCAWLVLVYIDEFLLEGTSMTLLSSLITPVGVIAASLSQSGYGIAVPVQLVLAGGLFMWGLNRFKKLTGRLS